MRVKSPMQGASHYRQNLRTIAPGLLVLMLLGNQQAPQVTNPENPIEESEINEPLQQTNVVDIPTAVSILPAGTSVTVFLDEELSSQVAIPGDLFTLTVLKDVIQDDVVVIPAGAKGYGEVRFAKKKGAFGRAGLLDVSLRHIELCDGDVSIRGRFRQEGKGNGGAVVATWVAVGVFSGFITGKRGIMPDGQEFKARTANDIDAIECTLTEMFEDSTSETDFVPENPEAFPAHPTVAKIDAQELNTDALEAVNMNGNPINPSKKNQQVSSGTRGENNDE